MPKPPPLETRLICHIDARLGEVQDIGEVPGGRRRVVPIAGGRVEGPHLSGEILPGGADWQIIAADGSVSVEARYTLRASDGALILVHSRGVRSGDPAVLARLQRVRVKGQLLSISRVERRPPPHNSSAPREPAAVLIDLYEIR